MSGRRGTGVNLDPLPAINAWAGVGEVWLTLSGKAADQPLNFSCLYLIKPLNSITPRHQWVGE